MHDLEVQQEREGGMKQIQRNRRKLEMMVCVDAHSSLRGPTLVQ